MRTSKLAKNRNFYFILVLLSFIAYGNTLKNGFVLDDDVVFLQNKYVQEGVSAIPEILSHGFLYGFNQRNDQSYRPLVLINFALEKSLFGNNASVLHLFNVLYFALLSCLLFYFLCLLFRNYSNWIPFWISVLFVLHPIHTEVVANIKGRDELLHAIFLIVSFIAAFNYYDFKSKKYLSIALLAFFLALLCKETAVTYIVLLPLSIWFFRAVNLKELVRVILPFAGVLIAYFLLRNAVLDTVTFEDKMTVINNSLAAADTLAERIATNIIIFANYIKLLFFPHPLAWDYSYPYFEVVDFSNPIVILISVCSLLIIVAALFGLKSKNKFAFSILFFICSFSIVSNFFILIGSTLGERFLFFPSIAFCIFLVLTIEWGVKKAKPKHQVQTIGAVTLLIGIMYTIKTIDRNQEWETNFDLFESGVKATPNNSRAVSALASAYRTRAESAKNQKNATQNYQRAKEGYKKSVALYPENTDSWYNLGVVLMNTNEKEKAKIAFQKAIKQDPFHIRARNNLGVIYFQSNNFQAAAEQFRNCLKIDKNFQSAYANLGAVYHNLGDYEKARSNYTKAIQLNPNDQPSKGNLNKLPH